MVQSWYGGWNIWVYTESAWESHIVLLYEWLQNYFETKEPIRREWCTIAKKLEQQISSANHNASCCPVTDVLFVKRLEYKETTCWKH